MYTKGSFYALSIESMLTTGCSQGSLLLTLLVVTSVAGIFYRHSLWAWVLTTTTPIHNVFLLSVKCSLEFPLRLPFGIFSSCEARLRRVNPELFNLTDRLDSLEKYVRTHMSAANITNASVVAL